MKKHLEKAIIAVVMCVMVIVGDFDAKGIVVQAETTSSSPMYSCWMWILKDGKTRPTTFEDIVYTDYNWGDIGTVSKKMEVCNDVEAFADLKAELPNYTKKLIGENQEIQWFGSRKVGYHWEIYGEVVDTNVPEQTTTTEPTVMAPTTVVPTATPYMHSSWMWILKEGKERPKTFDDIVTTDYRWGDIGSVSKKIEGCNDESLYENLIVNIPSMAQKYVGKNQEIRWFGGRKVGYHWEMYGEVVEKKAVEPTATPYMHSSWIWILKEGKERPETFDDIVTTDYRWGDIGSVSKKIEGCNDESLYENLIVNIPSMAQKYVGENQEIRWFGGRKVGYHWEMYGEVCEKDDTEPPLFQSSKATASPTVEPTAVPTVKPTTAPIVTPTVNPTMVPTVVPTVKPTTVPTVVPTVKPTTEPTVTPTATYSVAAGFQILQIGQERPKTLEAIDECKWDWVENGKAKKRVDICNDEEAVNKIILKVPDRAEQLINEDEAIHWFSSKKVGYAARIYGEVYNVNVENSIEAGAEQSTKKELVVDTVADIEKLDAVYDIGTKIHTRGYYSVNDGGAATYEVEFRSNDQKYSTLVTSVGQHVNLVIENKTINLLQLGAGHCKTVNNGAVDRVENDDAARINEAITLAKIISGCKIYIPEGEYRCATKINMCGNDYSIVGDGNKTILYTDNGYGTVDEHFLLICGQNLTLKNLRVEARETMNRYYYRQCTVLYATDINILNCEFSIKENVISSNRNTDRQYTNITLYTGWHNVTIDNCLMEQLACVERGASLGLLDIWSAGCSGARVTNCVMRQNAHDEMLGIFTGEKASAGITDVVIENNKMYAASASNVSKKTMAITVAYDKSQNMSDIYIRNNHIEADIPSNLMTFGKLTNCVVEGNEFVVNNPNTSKANTIFDTRPGVTIKNNNITLTGGGFGTLVKNQGVFDGNTVNAKCNVGMASYHYGTFTNNTCKFEKGLGIIANSPVLVEGNTIEMCNGFTKNFFSYDCIEQDSIINNNKITYSYDVEKDREATKNAGIAFGGAIIYAGFHAGLNNHTIAFTNNKIYADCSSENKSVLAYGVGDETPQNFVIENNHLEKYYYVRGIYCQSANVSFVNNENEAGEEMNFADYL